MPRHAAWGCRASGCGSRRVARRRRRGDRANLRPSDHGRRRGGSVRRFASRSGCGARHVGRGTLLRSSRRLRDPSSLTVSPPVTAFGVATRRRGRRGAHALGFVARAGCGCGGCRSIRRWTLSCVLGVPAAAPPIRSAAPRLLYRLRRRPAEIGLAAAAGDRRHDGVVGQFGEVWHAGESGRDLDAARYIPANMWG